MIGFSEDQATSTIRNAKLDPKVEHQSGPADTKGRVVATDPGASTTVAVGSTVTVKINDGPAATRLPDVRGKTEDVARQMLTSAGFTAIATKDASESQEGTESAAGTIVATDPGAGATVDPASPITLYRATGRSSVPDVSSLGVSADAAIKLLSQAGFHNVKSTPVAQCQSGIVCEQTPTAGTSYLRTDQVNILVGQIVSPSPSPSPTPRRHVRVSRRR